MVISILFREWKTFEFMFQCHFFSFFFFPSLCNKVMSSKNDGRISVTGIMFIRSCQSRWQKLIFALRSYSELQGE